MTRVLVTGGSGFIGTNAIDALIERGHDPVSFDIRPPPKREHDSLFRYVDLLDQSQLIRETSGVRPEAVLHLAARTDLQGRSVTRAYAANIDGVSNLIEAINATSTVRHAVFASSRLIHPIGYTPVHTFDYHPSTAYGESKVLGELIVRRYGPRDAGWTIVRPTSVWGPWMRDPNDQFFRMIARGLYVHPGSLNPPKQYSYVENGVAQMLRLTEAPRGQVHQKVYYLGDYLPLRLREWANEIQHQLDARPIRTVPASVLRLVARVGDTVSPVWSGVPLTSFRWSNMTAPVEFDLAGLREVLPSLPVPMETGVQRTIAWMRESGLL